METKLLPCVECGGDGFTMEPMYYDDGSLSRTLIETPCAACNPQDSLQTIDAYEALCDELAGALKVIVHAKALEKVHELVAGWNGKDGKNPRHESRLGARIETNCGRIYQLEEDLTKAEEILAKYESMKGGAA